MLLSNYNYVKYVANAINQTVINGQTQVEITYTYPQKEWAETIMDCLRAMEYDVHPYSLVTYDGTFRVSWESE